MLGVNLQQVSASERFQRYLEVGLPFPEKCLWDLHGKLVMEMMLTVDQSYWQ